MHGPSVTANSTGLRAGLGILRWQSRPHIPKLDELNFELKGTHNEAQEPINPRYATELGHLSTMRRNAYLPRRRPAQPMMAQTGHGSVTVQRVYTRSGSPFKEGCGRPLRIAARGFIPGVPDLEPNQGQSARRSGHERINPTAPPRADRLHTMQQVGNSILVSGSRRSTWSIFRRSTCCTCPNLLDAAGAAGQEARGFLSAASLDINAKALRHLRLHVAGAWRPSGARIA